MPKVLIVYYSRTGNTERMAKAVAEAIRGVEGVEVVLKYHVNAEELAEYDAIIVGTPTYHHDTVSGMKDLFENAATKNVDLKGKVGATFGSYGWSGEAPKLILEIMENKFEMQIIKPPLLVKYTPDQTGLEECREFGKTIAERLIQKA